MSAESFVLTMLVLVVYFLPTMIARGNKHHQTSAIFVLNLFLGWSVLGWVIALVWAFLRPSPHAPA